MLGQGLFKQSNFFIVKTIEELIECVLLPFHRGRLCQLQIGWHANILRFLFMYFQFHIALFRTVETDMLYMLDTYILQLRHLKFSLSFVVYFHLSEIVMF